MAATMGLSKYAVELGLEAGLSRSALLNLLAESSGRSFALKVLSRHGETQGMAFTANLQEKVSLLGEALGIQHPTYLAFKAAADQLTKLHSVKC